MGGREGGRRKANNYGGRKNVRTEMEVGVRGRKEEGEGKERGGRREGGEGY